PMVLAKIIGKNPRDIGTQIIDTFSHDMVEKKELAGPGFLNFFLTPHTFSKIAQDLFLQGEKFFRPLQPTTKRINLEFVSANPTGPLHIGNGRGGIIGDVLGNVLTFLGNTVIKEYYINDAGSQVKKLGMSLIIRCQQILGMDSQLPEDAYHGQYLVAIAKTCVSQYGNTVLEKEEAFFQEYAKDQILKNIKITLEQFGITFDVWFSEKTLHEQNFIEQTIQLLWKKNVIYEHEGAWWFRATQFGDDKDRVVKKASGEWTYVAADFAYIKNKIDRGAHHLIFVLGHDHHSYAIRLEAARQALDLTEYPLDIILYQLVKLKEEGQQVRMSKRAGTLVLLSDLVETVGTDVARFFFLNRKADAPLDFDLDLALKKTEENPVYYIQYAFVRTKSILNNALQEPHLYTISAADAQHLGVEERVLLKKIVSFADLLDGIARHHQTHLLAYYCIELAHAFHHYYSHVRVLDAENIEKSRARLLLITILKNTFDLGLKLMGIGRPEKM
ncbi:MAG TPA: arginine--tRNA ligase, partial [Candidatus Bathyarchaeia archaeon]|nr:arginine--tRNA ligase [Candidatus Bathyarchaeia archaeon]